MRRFSFVLLLAAVSCVPLPGAKQDSVQRLKAAGKIMTVDEVAILVRQARASGETLKGHGISVFEGTEPERFEIEVIDVMKNYIMPGHDLILFRGVHEKWLDGGNIIAGMSGSPCFINGKLIGALAYGMGYFQKDPLGGITPIEYMLRDMDRPVENKTGMVPRKPTRGLVPVRTPLLATGFGDRGMDMLEKHFGRQHFTVARGGSASGAMDAPTQLIPGGAIGAQLMSGDYDLTATGTVTYVEGEHVLAFGHSFFAAGELQMPITSAVVHTTFRGAQDSMKLSSSGVVLGALVHDRENSIYGRIGKTASMIPVRMSVGNPNVGSRRVLNFKILNNRRYTSTLLRIAIDNSLDAFEPSTGTKVKKSVVTLKLKNGRTVRFQEIEQETGGGGGFFFFGRGGGVISKVSSLVNNDYKDPGIESIDVELSTVNEDQSVTIKDALLLTPELEPGGTARVRLKLKKWRGKEVRQDLEFRVPETVEPGSTVELRLGGGNDIAPDTAPATNLDEFITALETDYHPKSIVLSMELPSLNLEYKGRILDRFPASVMAPLVPSLEENAYVSTTTVRKSVKMDWIVNGTARFKIKIRKRGSK